MRENVRFWVDLRNAVAHRHLSDLDIRVIPEAQAGLLNMEQALVELFGTEYGLGERMSVPLQLSGFRDPDVLRSLRMQQAGLPLDIQAILSRAETASPELLSDATFQLRVAFLPVVPASGRGVDAVAYFVKPGEMPTELADSLAHYVVLPKAMRGQKPVHGAVHVAKEVSRRTGFKFSTNDHAAAGRYFGVRTQRGEEERTLDELFAEYVQMYKGYLYTQRWIDRLVDELGTEEGYAKACGHYPRTDGAPLFVADDALKARS